MMSEIVVLTSLVRTNFLEEGHAHYHKSTRFRDDRWSVGLWRTTRATFLARGGGAAGRPCSFFHTIGPSSCCPRTDCGLCQAAQRGFPDAESYRSARRILIDRACSGDELVFFAAWNSLVAEGRLQPLLRAPIGSVLKPTHRRPVAIVPRSQLTPQLAEGRIVLDLGDDRFWLLPRDWRSATVLFTMRHGISRVESKTHRVGRRLANQLDQERGVPRADAVGTALAQWSAVVGQQLDFLRTCPIIWIPHTFLHFISHSPNTRQLYERVASALICRTLFRTGTIIGLGIIGLRMGHGRGKNRGGRGSCEGIRRRRAYGETVDQRSAVLLSGRQFIFRLVCRCDRRASQDGRGSLGQGGLFVYPQLHITGAHDLFGSAPVP